MTPGSNNVINKFLVEPSKVLLPQLHIKLGLIKQFVKAFDKINVMHTWDIKIQRYLIERRDL